MVDQQEKYQSVRDGDIVNILITNRGVDQQTNWSFTGSECLSNMPLSNFSTESEDRALSGQCPRWLQ